MDRYSQMNGTSAASPPSLKQLLAQDHQTTMREHYLLVLIIAIISPDNPHIHPPSPYLVL